MTRRAYTVIWDEELLSDLAAFWLESTPEVRQELTSACHEIDRTLARAPQSVGRPLKDEPAERVWNVHGPTHSIAVAYRVHEADQIARVAQLRLTIR